MPDKIHLEIVSAEEQLFSSDVEMVFAPAEMGEVGISPKHTPLITRLKPGDVRAQINKDQIETFFVSGGILEIQPNEVTILSDTALREEDLDEERALEAERAAKEAMPSNIQNIMLSKQAQAATASSAEAERARAAAAQQDAATRFAGLGMQRRFG